MPKKFLNVTEVSKILGVAPLTIRNWDKKGRLVAYRNPFNNYRMYKVEDVEQLLKNIESTKGGGSLRKSPKEKASPRKLSIKEL